MPTPTTFADGGPLACTPTGRPCGAAITHVVFDPSAPGGVRGLCRAHARWGDPAHRCVEPWGQGDTRAHRRGRCGPGAGCEDDPARDFGCVAERGAFWRQVRVTSGCWLWTGGTNHEGYGMLKALRSRRSALAHRTAYALLVGPIPAGAVLRHGCDEPRCVRPDHLRPGTHAENAADRVARGRARNRFSVRTRGRVGAGVAGRRAERVEALEAEVAELTAALASVAAVEAGRIAAHLLERAAQRAGGDLPPVERRCVEMLLAGGGLLAPRALASG